MKNVMIAGIPVGVLSCVYDVFMKGGMNMGQKDLSEKLLADYNDVFADIINVLILGGQHKIYAKDLITETVHSQYKADDQLLHERVSYLPAKRRGSVCVMSRRD